ncbi:hypothetical protein IFM89_031242 [Coptis chinensis]|uniref:Uncharacterized protein n=1 Tax=Coptis chinensis TaxID=261450 RepID=A0A835IS83_9MAGN|nr:hypothetical protein IFM89_031242 [Coptis chinensis]
MRNGNSASSVENIFTSVHAECDMQGMLEGLNLEYWEVKNLLAMERAFERPTHGDDTTSKSFNGVLLWEGLLEGLHMEMTQLLRVSMGFYAS